MYFTDIIRTSSDYLLFLSSILLLAGSVWLTLKTRFVQIRFLPKLLTIVKTSMTGGNTEGEHTVTPYKALFTAMSTTLGIGTIVAPVIAIHLGGPGALLGFLLTAFFGSAATYTEVNLSVQYRQVSDDGKIMGGPMQYLKHLLSPSAAKAYAVLCFVLMIVWSGAQSNQVADILGSPLMGSYGIPKVISGTIMAGLVLFLLTGGIKRIGSFSQKLVPLMFVLYLGSSLWIILSNFDRLWEIFGLMFQTTLSPYAMTSGALVGGLVSSLRWGVYKGIHVSEAGIGTQSIPHAMAETKDPVAQGVIAMLSTYTSGFVAFLSGCVALITGTWEDPSLPLGMSMVAASMQMYFSSFGTAIIAISALLFGFGTILGNSYNGSQCFGYLTNNRWNRIYFVGTALMVFGGALAEVTTLWALTDIVLGAMALLHITGLVVSAHRKPVDAIEPVINTGADAVTL